MLLVEEKNSFLLFTLFLNHYYQKFSDGQILCEEGEVADRFFIIVSGQCSVTIASKDKDTPPVRVATLHALDFLGKLVRVCEWNVHSSAFFFSLSYFFFFSM